MVMVLIFSGVVLSFGSSDTCYGIKHSPWVVASSTDVTLYIGLTHVCREETTTSSNERDPDNKKKSTAKLLKGIIRKKRENKPEYHGSSDRRRN